MKTVDILGNTVTGDDPVALAGINDFILGMLAYERRAANVIAAADAAPGHCLVNVYAGFIHLLGETAGQEEGARPYLAAAEAAAAPVGRREKALVAALGQWVMGDIDGLIATLQHINARYYRDLLTAKLLQYHQFNRGHFAGMLRAALRCEGADSPYVHGMIAFGYEQCHLLEEAEAAARRGLEMLPREPWAQHALAHVMLTQGRIDEGAAFLEAARPGWTDLNSFMETHLWWHLALFYLSQGRNDEALAAYDDHVWAVAKDYSQDQISAVSLLARMEMSEVAVGDRWTDVASWLAPRAEDVTLPFLSVQYLYGLARAGRAEADTLFAAIARKAEAEGGVWRDAALPLATGILAYVRREWETAVIAITGALPHLTRLGGSHAQRDLFEQILLQAHIHAHHLHEAQQMLELRRAHDRDGVPVNRALAMVYRRLGLPELSMEASRRVGRRLGIEEQPVCILRWDP